MVYPALLPLMPHTSGCQQSTELTPHHRADLNGLGPVSRERRNLVSAHVSSHLNGLRPVLRERRNLVSAHVSSRLNGLGPFRAKDEIWFLRMRHHISTGLHHHSLRSNPEERNSQLIRPGRSLKPPIDRASFGNARRH